MKNMDKTHEQYVKCISKSIKVCVCPQEGTQGDMGF